MWGNSLNLNPETDSGLPWAPFPEKFYTLRCWRRIAAHFAMQMKSKRSQIDNSMGTRPILYLQMGFEMCDGVRFRPNSLETRPDSEGNCEARWKIAYGFIAALNGGKILKAMESFSELIATAVLVALGLLTIEAIQVSTGFTLH